MQNNDVYKCINISNVINKLNLKKTKQIGSNIYLICPFCQSKSEKKGYMKANIIKNVYICNNCEASGSSIDLYAKLKYISTREAYKLLIKEFPVLDNMPYIYNNPVKDEYYRDYVYNTFLDMQTLTKKHREKLNTMNFADDYIIKNRFKSIENRENKKKEICKKLQEKGIKLDGIPGFMQDKDFKWTYKSHKGIFIPATLNNKIQGLRIFLDEKYQDTENIWFSSNNEYNGTKASNWPVFLKSEDKNWIEMYNTKKNDTIIIATEIILAHKLFNNTNETVIGVPNNINADILLNIVHQMQVKEIFLYVDNYTISHTSTQICQNIIRTLEKQGIKVNFRVALTDLDIKNERQEKNLQQNVA